MNYHASSIFYVMHYVERMQSVIYTYSPHLK